MGEFPIKVLPASENDLSEIETIEKNSFSVPWSEGSFREELVRPFSYLYVAKPDNGRLLPVLGYVCFWILFGELHLLNLAVHSDYRRKGIGRNLLEFALNMGETAGVEMAALEVRPSNTAAVNLYEQAGFVEVGRRRGYYSDTHEDAIIMELVL